MNKNKKIILLPLLLISLFLLIFTGLSAISQNNKVNSLNNQIEELNKTSEELEQKNNQLADELNQIEENNSSDETEIDEVESAEQTSTEELTNEEQVSRVSTNFINAVKNRDTSYTTGVRRYLSDNFLNNDLFTDSEDESIRTNQITLEHYAYSKYNEISLDNLTLSDPISVDCTDIASIEELCLDIGDTFTQEISFDQDIKYNFAVLENNSDKGEWYRNENIQAEFLIGYVNSLSRYEIIEIKNTGKFPLFWQADQDPYNQELIMACTRIALRNFSYGDDLDCTGVKYGYLIDICEIDESLIYPNDIICRD